MNSFTPSYIQANKKGLLDQKILGSYYILKNCTLCPRKCGVNRLKGELGICNTGKFAYVSSYQPHFGEEDVLVGKNGSGTIFFTNCNLMCNFCQNFDISHLGVGEEFNDKKLANAMLHLQQIGCENINFVSPSHVIPQILSALKIAIENGLCLPLIYNTGCYDEVNTLKLLSGIFDIYMPDFKFWNPKVGVLTCNVKDYPKIAREAIREMFNQVGDLELNEIGIAQKGLLIRHLVLPEELAGTKEIMNFIFKEISSNTFVNIMPQYRPCGNAYQIKELSRKITEREFKMAISYASNAGLRNLI